MNTHNFKNRAERTAGNDTRTSWRGTQTHAACAKTRFHIMMDRAGVAQGNAHHVAFCLISRLFNSFRNFAGFTGTGANAPAAITNDHNSGKTHAAAAFNRFRYAVDSDKAFDDFATFAFFAIPAFAPGVSRTFFMFCHFFFPLK
jgi:hypothetical protein